MSFIRRFLNSFRTAWTLQRFQFDHCPEWDMQTDGPNLRAWFATPTGRKFVGRLDWQRCQMMAEATLETPAGGREFACGKAHGFNQFFATVAQLSPTVRETKQDTAKEALTGAEDLLEQFAP